MFFESVAYAMAQPQAGAEQGNPIMAFLPLILMFAIFYFLLIRPQSKRAKEHRAVLAALKKGDRILTTGGIYGRITAIEGDLLTIEVAANSEIKINRAFVASLSDPTAATKVEEKPAVKG